MSPTRRCVAVALACLCFVVSARADIVILHSGLTLEGIVSRKGDKVEVRVPEGLFVYRSDVVKEIRQQRGSLHEYEQLKAQVKPGDAAGQWKLGLFCESKNMHGLAREAFERVVRLDPKHVEAHVKLGHIRVGDEWFSEWAYQEKLGHVRVHGEWLSRDVAAAREELRQMNWEVRSAAVTAYYQRLIEDERAAAGVAKGPSACAVVSAKSPGPWMAETLWEPGQKLRIVFADGTPELQSEVRSIAPEWCRYANLDFVFEQAGPDTSRDDIRITFEGAGAHSMLGRQSASAARAGRPSMQLSVRTHKSSPEQWRRTILHEFGHAVGLLHEHQNPNRKFKWNEDFVRKYYSAHGMSNEETEHNVLANLGEGHGGKEFDPRSIMMYAIPKESNSEGLEVGLNSELSPLDKQVASALYPGRGTPAPAASPVAVQRTDNRDMYRLTAAVRMLRREVQFLGARPPRLPSAPERLASDLAARARSVYRATESVDKALAYRIRALGSRAEAARVNAVNGVSRELAMLVRELNDMLAAQGIAGE